jgi:hypothetical protein
MAVMTGEAEIREARPEEDVSQPVTTIIGIP